MSEPIAENESELIDPASREVLVQLLTGLLPLVKPLQAETLRSAAEKCLGVLQAPGPVRKLDLAPFIAVVNEQCAELFRRGASELHGQEREVLSDLAEQADQEASTFGALEVGRKTLH
jgi:hypothetical protein